MRRSTVISAFVIGHAIIGCGSTPPPTDTDAGARRQDAGVDAGPPPPSRAAARPLTQWVDPFIGTGGNGFNDIGSTFPGPQVPFGMIRPGPDTENEHGAVAFLHCSGYAATDDYITAFSHTRMNGVGITDYGAVAIMPAIGIDAARTDPDGRRSHIASGSQTASPGYYAVTLDDPSFGAERTVRVELTSGARAAIHRWTFPEGAEAIAMIDLGHALPEVDVTEASATVRPEAREVEGFARFVGGYSGRFGGMPVYFVMRFDRAFRRSGTWHDGALDEGATTTADAAGGVFVGLDLAGGTTAHVAVGISFIDVAHARASLELEAADLDFDRMRDAASAQWERWLEQIEIEARTEREFRLFYTSLYHAYLMPTLATEADGTYRGLDGEVHTAEGFTYSTDLSLWDTYRTLHPWLVLVRPDEQRDFVRSMMAMAEQNGWYPRWPLGIGETLGMLGEPAAIVIADTWIKQVRDFDLEHAYELFDATAYGDPAGGGGRSGMEPYLRLGWVSIEDGGSAASRTLEFAYADDALATMAHELGRADEEAALRARGRNYANLWDPAQELLVGRHEDGSFGTVRPTIWDDVYAEGNAWQYLWLAPHDLEGLAETLGGRDRLLERLGYFFDQSARERRTGLPPAWYWHGNEPDLHAPWIFGALGDPDSTARWAAWAREVHYDDTPLGLPGNDDSGTMSAWYLFAALGFYPLAGESYYVIGSPRVTRAVVHLPAGDLVVEAPDAASGVVYVQRLTLDGEEIPRDRIEHARLSAGGTLRFELAAEPAR